MTDHVANESCGILQWLLACRTRFLAPEGQVARRIALIGLVFRFAVHGLSRGIKTFRGFYSKRTTLLGACVDPRLDQRNLLSRENMIRHVTPHLYLTGDNGQQAALAAVTWKNKRPFAVIAEEIAEPIRAKSGNVPLGAVAEETGIFKNWIDVPLKA